MRADARRKRMRVLEAAQVAFAAQVCVPKTYATWADVLYVAVGLVPRLVPGQIGGANLAKGATILGLWA